MHSSRRVIVGGLFFLVFSCTLQIGGQKGALSADDLPGATVQRITVAVSSGLDDAVEAVKYGTLSITLKSVYPGRGYIVGYRFSQVDIPPGSEVLSATLYQYCSGYETRSISLRYLAEAAASALPFSKTVRDLSGRQRTQASQGEADPLWAKNAFNPSPDLRDVIQEIVDLPGWESGNALALFVEDLNSASTRKVDHYEYNDARAAMLEVSFMSPTPVEDLMPPIVIVDTPAESLVTEQASVDLTGRAYDNVQVTQVVWESDRGESGTAVGTSQWSISALSLHEGLNTITIRAYDRSGNHGEAYRLVYYEPPLPAAFQGYGQATTGGEGYPVYVATSSTEFSQIQSLVKSRGGNAVIRLAGTWTHGSNVSFTHMANFTIDGLNAQVTLDGASLYLIDCQNVVIQGLRVRKHQTGDDCIQVNSCQNVVIDHCSVSEAGDGNLDITGYSYGQSRAVTVSWCILANTWKQSLVKYGGTTEVTFHHNLFYNGGGRFPQMSEGILDFRNNVIWQWGSYGTTLTTGAQANIINNYYSTGYRSKAHAALWYMDADSKAWVSGNVFPPEETDGSRLSGALTVPLVDTQSAAEAKNLVLDQAGAYPRDVYDLSIIGNVKAGVFPALPPYHD